MKSRGDIRVSRSGNEGAQYHLKEGVDVGEPDLWIYMLGNDGICYFLRLELKTKTGKLNDNQLNWNEWFDREYGNCTNHKRAVAYGFAEAREIIKEWITSLTPAPQGH